MVPDLSQLMHLESIRLPDAVRIKLGLAYGNGIYWARTRNMTVLCRRKFFFGGARSAIYEFLMIKRFTSVLEKVGKDVVNVIVQMLYESREDRIWARADKLMYDRATYHCSWPPPFKTLLGPSVFDCACGFKFGVPEDVDLQDNQSVYKLQQARNNHFVRVYNSDENGYCTFESRHYPLNRGTNKICCV